MTPLQPIAAVAVGAIMGLAALTAPGSEGRLEGLPTCGAVCVGAVSSVTLAGQHIPAAQLHMITRPGRYGLGSAPEGSAYAVADRHIVRIGVEDGRVLSVLRPVQRILD